jgi:hypothetical protein
MGISTPAFKVHQCVNTVYGPGWVEAYRAQGDYIVKLGNWQLAQGQSPTLYLAEDALKAIPGAMPGSTVSTVYGMSKMLAIRGDGAHICSPINWYLANKTHATMYLQPEAVKLDMVAGLDEGDAVMTIYGQGYVESIRMKDIVVKLDNWALAQGQSPTLFLDPTSVVKIPGFRIGQAAKTVWGMVRVVDIQRDGKHVCESLHWTLADGGPVRFYLNPEAFALMSIKPGAF